jgi:hypothetical protein
MIERAIYSLWTKPMTQGYIGFNSEKALMECFALSLHYSKKWFKEIHFITDIKGKKLIEKYGLKFDYISTEFDDALHDVDEREWSLGKIWACKIQDKPFVHIDNDVILFKPLPKDFLAKEAVFQNSEKTYTMQHYNGMMQYDKEHYEDRPKWYNVQKSLAYNCGLLGFNRFDFLDEWWESAIKHVDYLKQRNGYPFPGAVSPLIYEQQYVGCLCNEYNYEVGVLTDYSDLPNPPEWIPADLASKLGYTHLLSQSKRKKETEDKVRKRLMYEGVKLSNIKEK